jgi:hypothetical protein
VLRAARSAPSHSIAELERSADLPEYLCFQNVTFWRFIGWCRGPFAINLFKVHLHQATPSLSLNVRQKIMNIKILTAILMATCCFCINGKSQLLDLPFNGGLGNVDLNPATPAPLNFTDHELFNNLIPPQTFVTNLGGWFLPQASGVFIAHPFSTGLESGRLNSITLSMLVFNTTQFDSSTGVSTNTEYTPIQGDRFIKVYSGSLSGVGNCIDTLTSYQNIGSSFVMFQSSAPVALDPGAIYWFMPGSTAPANSYIYNYTTGAEHTGSGDVSPLYVIGGDDDLFSVVHSDLSSVYVETRIGLVPIPEPSNYSAVLGFGAFCFLFFRKKRLFNF